MAPTPSRKPARRSTPTSKSGTSRSAAAKKAPVKKRTINLSQKAKSDPGSTGSFTAQLRAAGQRTGDLAKPTSQKVKQPETVIELARSVGAAYGDQNAFILDMPWEERSVALALGAEWNSHLREFIYVGNMLPAKLQPYQAEDFSWGRWIEDEINGRLRPAQPYGGQRFTPRPHQMEAIKAIVLAADAGWRGFIEADGTGLGKTLSTLAGVSVAAKRKGFTAAKKANLLVICPNTVVPHWRNTIRAAGIDNLRIMVVNYEKAKKLLSVPKSATEAKTTRTKNKRVASQGVSLIKWNYIISDEAHKMKNPDSQRTQAFNTVARYSDSHENAPFVIWSSATIGQNPVELAYLAPLIAQATKTPSLKSKEWGAWLEKNGFHVKERKVGYSWIEPKTTDTPEQIQLIRKLQKQDIDRLRNTLFNPKAPSIRRLPEDVAGWPEVTRSDMPVDLGNEDYKLYITLWKEFRKEMLMVNKGKNPVGALAIQTRFRQKASLLRVKETIDFAADLLENKQQVAISVEFIESLDAIRAGLTKMGVPVAEFSGRNVSEREKERLRFQRGQAKVILFTVEEGVSFHAGEQLPDGTTATTVKRAQIIHDVRYTALKCTQIEGRCHRDGQKANVYYMYANKTVERKILTKMLDRMAKMKTLSGDSYDSIEEIESMLLAG